VGMESERHHHTGFRFRHGSDPFRRVSHLEQANTGRRILRNSQRTLWMAGSWIGGRIKPSEESDGHPE
jgi:hypothetical protein